MRSLPCAEPFILLLIIRAYTRLINNAHYFHSASTGSDWTTASLC